MHKYLSRVYLHFVWSTFDREPIMNPAVLRTAIRSVTSEAEKLKCRVRAIGGTADHVHLAVELHVTVSQSAFMNQVKGTSSRTVGLEHPELASFAWQHGYAAFSYGPRDREAVEDYVRGQQRHHATGALWASCETPPRDLQP